MTNSRLLFPLHSPYRPYTKSYSTYTSHYGTCSSLLLYCTVYVNHVITDTQSDSCQSFRPPKLACVTRKFQTPISPPLLNWFTSSFHQNYLLLQGYKVICNQKCPETSTLKILKNQSIQHLYISVTLPNFFQVLTQNFYMPLATPCKYERNPATRNLMQSHKLYPFPTQHICGIS